MQSLARYLKRLEINSKLFLEKFPAIFEESDSQKDQNSSRNTDQALKFSLAIIDSLSSEIPARSKFSMKGVIEMATINGMLGGTYTAYSTAQKNGTLFSSLNSKKSSASDSINSLWSSTSTSNLSSMGTVLSGLSTINSNVKNLLSSYDTTKETFQMEFDDAMSDLSKAASKMKSYDFSKAAAAGVGTSTTTVDEKTGETTTTVNRPEAMKDALKTVQDLVDSYNSAIDFFNDNSEVSKRVSNMSKTFSDTTYRSALYDQVGITVGSDGKLTVNEDKLAAKIVEDPNSRSRWSRR